MEESSPAPIREPDTASLDCRLCSLTFRTVEEKRQHAKSESHVHRIRCRIAEAAGSDPQLQSEPTKSSSPRRRPTSIPRQTDFESSEESASDTSSSSDKEAVKFVAEDCLFCNHTSSNFNENLAHMQQAHSLTVPFQSFLSVDLTTLIWFLHMVIFSYRECICCGKRRRTVEAVQHHMTSLGHCRFDVTEEMSGFYDMTALSQQTADNCSHVDDHTLRLPSGKLLAHRDHVNSDSRNRLREKPTQAGIPSGLPGAAAAAENESSPWALNLTKRDRKDQALTTQLARLRTGDQMGLMHLPESQRRSLLAAHKKELDKAKRAERRIQSRLDNVGNNIAVHTKYYKQEVPVYMGG
ncbi:hypothetical protein N657DRAFT_694663 [Parathielavia appendiculata]|uniref:C2H2-type domain-containing protein n=1 Tax=Parathielavia appendiculata TaxID=2587402 RepID=A0AAN6TPR3_9PEZI|nr:hypothetical protein N657DRAFT_694663 [Parathielavia appendiculata]